jgi:hypothetical protein
MARTPSKITEDNYSKETAFGLTQEIDYVPPPGRLIVRRKGHSITGHIPKPVVLIDTREWKPG